jgi:hypothetical protein
MYDIADLRAKVSLFVVTAFMRSRPAATARMRSQPAAKLGWRGSTSLQALRDFLAGDFRQPFHGGGDLSDQFLGAGGRLAGELGQVDHRDQFANPSKGAEEVVVRLLPDMAKAGEVLAAGPKART